MRAQEQNLEPIDTRLEILAEAAIDDSKYQRMLYHTEEATPLEDIEKDCELYLMGSERQNLSIFTCRNGCRLLIKNSEEVVVPQCARADVLNELHSTRGKFTWKNIGKDIEKLYNQCEMCKEHSRSKPNIPGKRNEVIPMSLELGYAGELSVDFGQFGRNNLLIVKDRYSDL